LLRLYLHWKKGVFYIKIAIVMYLSKCKILVETRSGCFVPWCSWLRSAPNNTPGVDLYWLGTGETTIPYL